MFVVEVGAVLTTGTAIAHSSVFNWTIVVWLWLTVVFANLAEAVAEGRGKAQAETLRRTKRETVARRLTGWQPGQTEVREEEVPGTQLTLGDHVVVEAGEIIPGDGDVVEGVASVDESAITGESAPVIRESGGDRSAVTGGTKVLSDRIVVKITSKPGRDLHRPDDRAGRGREAAEDAERAGAEHPARRADRHLHARGDHAAADGVLLQGAADPGGPGRAARRADPDHDRRAAVRDRHRRHGPAGPAERAGHVRARGRGGRRREHAAAGQDRHDHHRQPAGDRVPPGGRRVRGGTRGRRAAVQHGRLHPGGPVHRGAREGPVRPAGAARGRTEGRRVRGVHRADPDERRGPGRWAPGPQGRRRLGLPVDPGQRRHPAGWPRADGGQHLRCRRHAARRRREGQRDRAGRWA